MIFEYPLYLIKYFIYLIYSLFNNFLFDNALTNSIATIINDFSLLLSDIISYMFLWDFIFPVGLMLTLMGLVISFELVILVVKISTGAYTLIMPTK